jgi:hypothetical protein
MIAGQRWSGDPSLLQPFKLLSRWCRETGNGIDESLYGSWRLAIRSAVN